MSRRPGWWFHPRLVAPTTMHGSISLCVRCGKRNAKARDKCRPWMARFRFFYWSIVGRWRDRHARARRKADRWNP